MKKFVLTLALLLTLSVGVAGAADKKLARKDFNLIPRVERVESDVAELKSRLNKLEQLIEDKAAKKAAAALPEGASPRPDGEGWQYNAAERSWWRYAPQQQAAPQSYVLPAGGYFQGGCPNGRCPTSR